MRLGWFSELDARERRTFLAAFGGLGLDSIDTTIFALVMPVLISLAILTKAEAGALASLSRIGCGIGGWFASSLADRFGRVRMLRMTVVWVAVFTALAAFMHGFWGFAFGRGGTICASRRIGGAKWLCGRLRGLSRGDAGDLLLGATIGTTDDKWSATGASRPKPPFRCICFVQRWIP